MAFFLNPKRRILKSWQRKLKYYTQFVFVRFGVWLGFEHIDFSRVEGGMERFKLGKRCSTINTVFNTSSGYITVGDDTIFGYDCMVLTGEHQFYKGKRARLIDPAMLEVPSDGNDIAIGSGCHICSGTIIIKGVTIGDNVIIGAGSVVTKDIPSDCFAAGCPAKVIRYHQELSNV